MQAMASTLPAQSGRQTRSWWVTAWRTGRHMREIVDAGTSVIVVDQQGPADFGGQAYWSFGGLFMVNTPEQRRLGIKDSCDLAMRDWLCSAEFSDGPDDYWPRRWAAGYVDFAAGEKRRWLRSLGWRAFPVPVWPERGGHGALGSGNSVPRFHVTWGTGPGLVEVFARRVQDAISRGKVTLLNWHRVDELTVVNGAVTGVRGKVLQPSAYLRGEPTSNAENGDFAATASSVLLATGGVGGSLELVRELFTRSFGTYPDGMRCGNPAYVNGAMVSRRDSSSRTCGHSCARATSSLPRPARPAKTRQRSTFPPASATSTSSAGGRSGTRSPRCWVRWSPNRRAATSCAWETARSR